jgi:DNA-binding winged helix-turn-helix (wHTH) protein
MEVEGTTRTYGVSKRRMKSRMSSLLLVGNQDAFRNTGAVRLFDGPRFQLVAGSSSMLDALSILVPGTIDLVLLSHEFKEEEVNLFARDARRRGCGGLILHTVDSNQHASAVEPRGNDLVLAGDIVVNALSHRVWVRGMEIRCSALEFELLTLLCRHPDQMLSHASLLEALWGDNTAPRHSLRVLIRSVRAKIEISSPPRYIVTQRRVGYRFVPSPSPIYQSRNFSFNPMDLSNEKG